MVPATSERNRTLTSPSARKRTTSLLLICFSNISKHSKTIKIGELDLSKNDRVKTGVVIRQKSKWSNAALAPKTGPCGLFSHVQMPDSLHAPRDGHETRKGTAGPRGRGLSYTKRLKTHGWEETQRCSLLVLQSDAHCQAGDATPRRGKYEITSWREGRLFSKKENELNWCIFQGNNFPA